MVTGVQQGQCSANLHGRSVEGRKEVIERKKKVGWKKRERKKKE